MLEMGLNSAACCCCCCCCSDDEEDDDESEAADAALSAFHASFVLVCVCDRFHQSLSVVYLVCECVCLHRHHCVCHDCGSEKRQKRKKKDSMKTQSPLSSIDREVCVSLSEFREPSLHPSNSHSLLTQFHFVATANYHTRDRRVKQKTRKQGNGMKRSKKKEEKGVERICTSSRMAF